MRKTHFFQMLTECTAVIDHVGRGITLENIVTSRINTLILDTFHFQSGFFTKLQLSIFGSHWLRPLRNLLRDEFFRTIPLILALALHLK